MTIGYVWMTGEGDILLDVEDYDAAYDPGLEMTLGHTRKDTYPFYDGGTYKEYGATRITEEEFLTYQNAQALKDKIEAELKQPDTVSMELEMRYDYEKKELIYEPVHMLQGDLDNIEEDIEEYTDERTIDEYLNRYGLTREDVRKYQDYAIYEVVVKTWTRAYKESYWLESWKLKRCKVIDNTFRFEED